MSKKDVRADAEPSETDLRVDRVFAPRTGQRVARVPAKVSIARTATAPGLKLRATNEGTGAPATENVDPAAPMAAGAEAALRQEISRLSHQLAEARGEVAAKADELATEVGHRLAVIAERDRLEAKLQDGEARAAGDREKKAGQDRLATELAATRAELVDVRGRTETTHAAMTAAATRLAAAVEQNGALEREVAELHARVTAAEGEALERTRERDGVRGDLETLRGEAEGLRTERDHLRQARDLARDEAQAEAANAHVALDEIKRERDAARDLAATMRTDLATVRAELAEALEQRDQTTRELEAARTAVQAELDAAERRAQDRVQAVQEAAAQAKAEAAEGLQAAQAEAAEAMRVANEALAQAKAEAAQALQAANAHAQDALTAAKTEAAQALQAAKDQASEALRNAQGQRDAAAAQHAHAETARLAEVSRREDIEGVLDEVSAKLAEVMSLARQARG